MYRPVVLITGATRGIGRAIASNLAVDHTLLIGGRHADAVEATCREFPDASPFVADLGDAESVASAAAGVERCDVVIHNAALASYGSLATTSREQWREMFEVNVFAVAQLTSALLAQLREANGHVITINSGAGFNAGAGSSLYSATKFALRAMTDALRLEEPELRVTSIHPGRTATDMQAELWEGSSRAYQASDHMDPADVAAAVRLAIELPHSTTITELSVRPTHSVNPSL